MDNYFQKYSLQEMFTVGVASKRYSDCVVFIASTSGKFTDNVKYLFLYAATHACGFSPYLYTSDKETYDQLREAGLPAINAHEDAFQRLLSAGAVVYDTMPTSFIKPYFLGSGALQVQLWHGVGLKKLGKAEAESAVNDYPGKQDFMKHAYPPFDVVASLSPWTTKHVCSTIFDAETFLDYGYPRNDVLLRDMTPHDSINVDADVVNAIRRHKAQGGKVAIYVPTFRDRGDDFMDDAGNPALNLEKLSAFARQHNILMVFKLHRYTKNVLVDGQFAGILSCDNTMDIYPVLRVCDTLITDYSTLSFDFLTLNRPLVFFPYDIKRYTSINRELNFPYEEITPGHVCYSQDALHAALHALLVLGTDPHEAERNAFRHKVNPHYEPTACQNIAAYIHERLVANESGNGKLLKKTMSYSLEKKLR